MHAKLNLLSDTHYQREHPKVIERHGDNVLVICDMPAGPLLKTLLLTAAGAIFAVAVLAALVPRRIAAGAIVIFTLFASAAVMTRRTHAEIDLADREITITQKVFGLVNRKVYPLDDYQTSEIQSKTRLIEGYSLPFFFVRIVGTGKLITLYSTDDPEEAGLVQEEISRFLGKAGISTRRVQTG